MGRAARADGFISQGFICQATRVGDRPRRWRKPVVTPRPVDSASIAASVPVADLVRLGVRGSLKETRAGDVYGAESAPARLRTGDSSQSTTTPARLASARQASTPSVARPRAHA